jgi:hypothetical protein
MTMNAPNSSSNALNACEADGLVEGNGVSVLSLTEQVPTVCSSHGMGGAPEVDSRI